MASTDQHSTTARRGRPGRLSTSDLALVAGFAALIVVCAVLPAINVTGLVPITLQTFGVLLAGAALGPLRGFLAVLLYLALGVAGLPVFSGGAAGLTALAGTSAGYLIGFPLAAALTGFLVTRLPRGAAARSVPLVFLCGLIGSVVFIHTLGIAGLVLRADLTWAQAFDVDKVFWIGDVVKNAAMALVATAVHRAFPDLLHRRRAA